MQEEKKILKRFKNGDPDTFDQIFEKYYRKVYAFSLGSLRNKEDAEEKNLAFHFDLRMTEPGWFRPFGLAHS